MALLCLLAAGRSTALTGVEVSTFSLAARLAGRKAEFSLGVKADSWADCGTCEQRVVSNQ